MTARCVAAPWSSERCAIPAGRRWPGDDSAKAVRNASVQAQDLDLVRAAADAEVDPAALDLPFQLVEALEVARAPAARDLGGRPPQRGARAPRLVPRLAADEPRGALGHQDAVDARPERLSGALRAGARRDVVGG